MIEVETSADRSARRGRRAVVVATVAALIAGTAGFLLGRSTDDSRPGVGAVPSTVPATDEPADTQPLDTTPATAPDTSLAPAVTTVPMPLGYANDPRYSQQPIDEGDIVGD